MKRRSILVALILACLTINLSFSPDEYFSKIALAQKAKSGVQPIQKDKSTGQAVQKELPLSIQRVYLKGDKVYITVLRTGGGKVDPGDYSNIRMKVVAGSGRLLRHWSFSEVDRKKALVGAGGKVEFDTGIVLKERETVKAILSYGKWETSKQNVLLPIQSLAGTKKMAPNKMASQTHLQHQKTIAPPDPRKTPLHLDDSGGIRITLPTRGQSFRPGSSMNVQATFLTDTVYGMLTFHLKRGSAHDSLATIAVPFDPTPGSMTCQRVWRLPLGGLPSGSDYYVFATHQNGGLWGMSDSFTIGNLEGEGLIEVSRPRAGEGVTPGFTMHVNYRFTRRVEEGLVHIELYSFDAEGRHGRPVLARTQHHRPPGGAAPEPIRTIEWPIPEDTAVGRYFVLITHPEAWGRSRNFNVQWERTGYAVEDYALLDIFKDRDKVKARIRASGGTIADYVELSVNGSITRPIIPPGDSDIIIRDYSGASLGQCGEFFDVTIDPNRRRTETNEGNNSLRKFISWTGPNGRVWLPGHPSGTNVQRIACYRPDVYTPTVIVAIQNCSSEPVRTGPGSIEVRQSGRRPRTGGRLGYEDFDVVVPHRTFISNCDGLAERRAESEIPPGECGVIRLGIEDLSAVDSTLTYTFRNDFTTWPSLTNPYTVELDFGEWEYYGNSLTDKRCRYNQ